ncbi:MAG: alpha-L-glutamate ligase-like protein [Gammaproteobacteria bacterium]|nr:alpha-L-glutamate ligase-like protein [Gammaproteobacteria bacterium]
MISTWLKLRKKGVLGLNARNREFVMKHNPRHSYPLVDDKLRTKKLALAAGIAVPELYGTVTTPHDLARLENILAGRSSFVMKPAHGSGGEGVLVIDSRRRDLYVKTDGRALSLEDIEYHASNIMSGIYSLGGVSDTAMIEYRVCVDPVLEPMSYRGVPDIRVLVYRGVPSLAMIRLPTRNSDGKANLHQGAVGVGIEIATGITTDGVWLNRRVNEHPDFGMPLAGLQIPNWPSLLELAARSYELTHLGYLGVDIVLDRDYGPLILELNARPGLAIQIANQCGLALRLAKVDALDIIPTAARDRVDQTCRLFGTNGADALTAAPAATDGSAPLATEV